MDEKTKRRIVLEIFLFILLFIVFTIGFIKFDIFEKLYSFTRKNEAYEIDEILSALIAIMFSALIFSIRHIFTLQKIMVKLDSVNKELLKYEKEKFNKQKIVALESLASGLAHEIKNALQPTLGLGPFIREGLVKLNNQKYINYMDTIIDSSTHAHKIIENVLIFARKKEIEFSPENALEILDQTFKFCRDLLPTTIELKINGLVDNIDLSKNEKLLIKCNQTCFYQIFFNILNNAAKSIKQHGVIDIKISKGLMPRKIDMPSIQVTISDNGCGMDKETIDRIFDPFFSTKDISEGTGLGLTIVKTLIDEHNGDIKVRSNVGEGTVITLNFPIVSDKKK